MVADDIDHVANRLRVDASNRRIERQSLMVVIAEDGDLVGSLEDLNFKVPEDVRHRFVHAHGIGVGERQTGLRYFPALFDNLRRRGLEDRISVIADRIALLLVPVGVRCLFTTGPGPESGCSKPSIGWAQMAPVKSGIGVCAVPAPPAGAGACASAGEAAGRHR
jgi:hypothetical protein